MWSSFLVAGTVIGARDKALRWPAGVWTTVGGADTLLIYCMTETPKKMTKKGISFSQPEAAVGGKGEKFTKSR